MNRHFEESPRMLYFDGLVAFFSLLPSNLRTKVEFYRLFNGALSRQVYLWP